MKILVTGANGFIAKNFIKFALNKKVKIIAISRKKKFLYNKNLKWIKGTFNKINFKEYGKFDILVHFAAAGVKLNQKDKLNKILNVNVYQSNEMILNAIKNKCKKFLIVSSSSEFGDVNVKSTGVKKNDTKKPNSPYGLSKVMFNKIIFKLSREYNCKFRIMRLFPVYGPGENPKRLYSTIKRNAKEKKDLVIKNPFQVRDFSHIDFVVKNLFDALNFSKRKFKYYQTFHVSESNHLTILEFCKIFWKKFNGLGKLRYRYKKKQFTNHISHKSSNWRL